MARLQRIRGSARPGALLVDVDDPGLLEALGDRGLFEAEEAGDPTTSTAYPGLHRLPRIAHLTGIKDHPAALAISERIMNELKETRTSA